MIAPSKRLVILATLLLGFTVGIAQAQPVAPRSADASGPSAAQLYQVWFLDALKADPALAKAAAAADAGRQKEALDRYLILAKKGNVWAAYQAGERYAHGRGTARNSQLAVGWLHPAAEAGFGPAQVLLGELLESDPTVQDKRGAALYYLKAMDTFPKARYRLALMYLNGDPFPKDEIKAAALAASAGLTGLPSAQYLYATMLRDGVGVKADPAGSVAWFRMAARAGLPNAQLMLSQAYGTGNGTLENPALALDWARQAAQNGNLDAQLLTGLLLARGHGAATNADQAVFWLEMAAERYIKRGATRGAILTLVELEKVHPESAAIAKLKAFIESR
jgi:TPR repeat protein